MILEAPGYCLSMESSADRVVIAFFVTSGSRRLKLEGNLHKNEDFWEI